MKGEYMKEYDKYISKMPEPEVDDTKGDDVKVRCKQTSPTVGVG